MTLALRGEGQNKTLLRFAPVRPGRKALSTAFALLALLAGQNSARAETGKLWIEGSTPEPPVQLALPSFSGVIEKLGKAVVNISTEGKEAVPTIGRRGMPGMGEEHQGSPFDYFFQLPPEGEGKRSFSSLGSGFVISPDGYIVTNNHVVERASKITVSFRDVKKTYPAKIVGRDRKTDLALLKIDGVSGLDAATLGRSDGVKAGDWVIAIGNPFRLGHSATVGIVSAVGRRVPGGGPYDDFIQTDASINPGNSGGPLFNASGEVIGVNTAIYSPNRMGNGGFNIGIGFATPINIVKNVISQLHDRGKVVRGWLGVVIQPLTDDMAAALNLGASSGALVADIMPESPAAEAGIKRRDVIVKFDGKPVEENEDLPIMVADTELGRTVPVEVIRGGKSKRLDVKIRELKDEDEDATSDSGEEEGTLGLTVQDLTPDIAKSLGIDELNGVLVTSVAPDSAAENAGLRRGDVILEVGSEEVNGSLEFKAKTKDLSKNKPLLLLVRRGGNTVFLTLKVE